MAVEHQIVQRNFVFKHWHDFTFCPIGASRWPSSNVASGRLSYLYLFVAIPANVKRRHGKHRVSLVTEGWRLEEEQKEGRELALKYNGIVPGIDGRRWTGVLKKKALLTELFYLTAKSSPISS